MGDDILTVACLIILYGLMVCCWPEIGDDSPWLMNIKF